MRLLFSKNKLVKGFLLAAFLLITSASFGYQDCNDPLNPNPDFPDCDPDIYVPIDDGVYVLIAAGLIMGYQLLRKNKLVMMQK